MLVYHLRDMFWLHLSCWSLSLLYQCKCSQKKIVFSVGWYPDLPNIGLIILGIDSSFRLTIHFYKIDMCPKREENIFKQGCVYYNKTKKFVHNIFSPLSRNGGLVISLNFNADALAFLQLYHYFHYITFSLFKKGIPNLFFPGLPWFLNIIKKERGNLWILKHLQLFPF